jgi:hypothetical protein
LVQRVTVATNPLATRGVDAVQVSSHRGPPMDRLPDKPPPCKGAFVGYLSERADTRHEGQLASFARGILSLSGNATLLQKLQNKEWTPSDRSAYSQAGRTSLKIRRVRSWEHTSGDRSRVQRDTCVAIGHPSSDLGRNLFPCGVFLWSTESAGSIAHRDNRHSSVFGCTHPVPGPRAVVRCSQAPRWGQTK